MHQNEIDFEALAEHYEHNGYLWAMGGGMKIPTADDLAKAVNKMVERIENEPDQTKLAMGRLIVEKTGDVYDAYVYVGSVVRGR